MIATPDTYMTALADDLERDVDGVRTELSKLPSGAAMLDVRRSDGRAFVMAYSKQNGYSVDELGPEDGFTTHYKFSSTEFPPAAERLRELVSDNVANAREELPVVDLNLVVLYVRDLDAAERFYRRLGLLLRSEKHGKGPLHFSADMGSTLLEIYPASEDCPAGGGRVGFRIREIDQLCQELSDEGGIVVRQPRDSQWGRRAVVQDPSGNKVELTEVVL